MFYINTTFVGVVGNAGCERIHKEKKVYRAKFLFYVPKREKARYRDLH